MAETNYAGIDYSLGKSNCNPNEKWSSDWWKFEQDMADWYMDEGAYWPYPVDLKEQSNA